MYAKLIDGALQYAPKNFLTESGQYISNFNNNEDLMIKYGFKEVIDVRPARSILVCTAAAPAFSGATNTHAETSISTAKKTDNDFLK